jgi:hypothetical protein
MRDLDEAAQGSREAALDKDQPDWDRPDLPLTKWEIGVMRSGVHMPPREEWETLLESLQRTADGRTP